MKNSVFYSICGLVAVGALAVALVVTSGNRRATAEAVAKKARSEARAQEAKAKAAVEVTAQAQAEAKKAEAEKAARAEERRAKDAEREIEREKAKRAETETATAKAEARVREAKAKTAAAEAEKARAEEGKAKAAQAKAEAERDAKNAEADRAEADRQAKEIAAKTVKEALALEELRKKEYGRLLEETKALKAELDERERLLKPPKTVKDLMLAEAEPGGDLFAEDEYDEAPTAGFTRQKRKAKRILPENDRTLARGTRRLSRTEREMHEAVAAAQATTRSNLVAKLETLMRRAIDEDRIPDADFYLRTIKGLYPDYIPSKR